MSKWQPIETAPRDETHVLVWTGGAMTTAKYDLEFDWWEIVVPSEGYRESDCVSPTHWMPLPEPPEEKK